ncbi:MAG: hypothetical protein E7437_09200 [Ruminococcaceae bacterium]|nr:hypothetical protein [Oscillospiraceae bacterium]
MGNCEQCSGKCCHCGNPCLELTEGEIAFLDKLAQFAYLPVARRADDMTPIYLEDSDYTMEEYSLILQSLEARGLVSLDYEAPIKGADMTAYRGYPVHGCVSLTQRGQTAADLLWTVE